MLPVWVGAGARVSAGTGGALDWTEADLERHVSSLSELLSGQCSAWNAGLLCDNSPAWIAVDLAAQVAGTTLIPLPGFFSPAQLEHTVRDGELDALWCTDRATAARLGFHREVASFMGLMLFERDHAVQPPITKSVARHEKVTFTSGSTGTPKGVRLSDTQQLKPARALAELMAPLGIQRHLNLLPLSVLLENVAGVYVSLVLGATCISPSLARVGMSGSSGFDAGRCLGAIAENTPDSVILLPQMLREIVGYLREAGGRDSRIRSLKFVAVGGAKTSPDLILEARGLGLPVFEGYGLSECGSVVTVNTPSADRVGSVGRPLPGTAVRVAASGEIEVAGRGGAASPGAVGNEWRSTGDLGHMDSDGYLFIDGRKDNLLITSFGRNVSPEWPESLLLNSRAITQAAIFGEGRPYLAAVLSPRTRAVPDEVLAEAVRAANLQLPDYARIGAWVRAREPFVPDNGMTTANGRVRRSAVWARYAGELNALFDKVSVPS
jgi:long-subunit acyl-CoA synthetase (AMP-forming)